MGSFKIIYSWKNVWVQTSLRGKNTDWYSSLFIYKNLHVLLIQKNVLTSTGSCVKGFTTIKSSLSSTLLPTETTKANMSYHDPNIKLSNLSSRTKPESTALDL